MGFNAKLFEVVLYADSTDFKNLKRYVEFRSGLRHYAYIVHDKDGVKKHCHFMLRMNNTCNSDNVAKWFDAQPNQVEKCKGRWSDMLAYLTHKNASEKFQYDSEFVKSNFDWKKEADKAGNKGHKRLNEIIDSIASGETRRYNIHEFTTAQEFVKYRAKINASFEYRNKVIKGVNRDMKSIYIHGGSGTGKTTLAKQIAKDKDYSLFISSGSNDVLDDYEGQDCIILDDLRPSCLGLSDLLKMLDPRTASSVKSRYYNKTLECKLVIITTTKEMGEFFQQVFENEDEPLKQLERRCSTKIKMTKEKITIGMYDNKENIYKYIPSQINFVLESLEIEELTKEEILLEARDLFKSYPGYNKKPVKKKNNNSLVEDVKTIFGDGVEVSTIPF